jgi:hypothetical protein
MVVGPDMEALDEGGDGQSAVTGILSSATWEVTRLMSRFDLDL